MRLVNAPSLTSPPPFFFQVESGYKCTGRVGRKSSCAVPTAPTLYLAAAALGPFSEGGNASVTVRRMGSLAGNATVAYRTFGSTAFSDRKSARSF